MPIQLKLRDKIVIPISLMVVIIFLGMVIILVSQANRIFRNEAIRLAEEMAWHYGYEVQAAADHALNAARHIAITFEGIQKAGHIPDREILNNMLKNILTENREFLGVWTCWEPYTLDGRDDEYIHADGHDRTGRYMPFWHRMSSDFRLTPLNHFEHSRLIDDYIAIREKGAEGVAGPALVNLGWGDIRFINLVSPIHRNGRTVGAAGVLLPIIAIESAISRITPFETGYLTVISNSGTVVAHPNAALVGRQLSETVPAEIAPMLLQAVSEGKRFEYERNLPDLPQNRAYDVHVPFEIGKTGTPWSIAVTAPKDKVLENSRRIRNLALISGAVLLLVLIGVIFFVSRKIVIPLHRLVEVSRALAEGNFHARANLNINDEFGMAARQIDRAFDIVIDRLFWYESMLDAIPFPVSVTDLNMHWTFVNKKAETVMGRTREEVIGKHCKNRNGKICNTDQCGVVLLRKGITTSTFDSIQSDRHYQIDVAWLKNIEGERIGHIEIVQDITEISRLKRRADERSWHQTGETELNRLLSGDQNLSALCKNIILFLCKYLKAYAGAIYISDAETRHLRLEATYAYRKRKALSNEFRLGEGIVGQAALEKETILLTRVPEDYMQISSGLGEAKPGNIIVSPFVYDGEIKGVIEMGAFHDFTDLETRFLESVLQHVGIVVNTAQARTRMEALLSQTQIQAEELQVQQEELRQANEELEEQTRALRASEINLQEQQEELRVINEELEDRNRALEKQKDDIQKKNKALQEAQKEIELKARDLEIAGRYKSEFLANMSHELRTPLNSILILSQLLSENKEDNLNPKQKEFAETIHSSGSDLLSLINDILDLSKVEAGKLEMLIEEMSISELIHDVRRTFEPVAAQKNLGFEVRMTPETPPVIDTDIKRVWQILKNLLSNAFKFTETGHVALDIFRPPPKLHFSAEGLEAERSVAFAVTDTGIGIAEAKQQHIFQAFQQADGTTSRKYGGTGLGLSISREFARALGGEIHLESRPDRGSVFTLYLPDSFDPDRTRTPLKKAPPPRPSPVVQEPPFPETPLPETIPPDFVKDDRRHLRPEDKILLIIEDDPNFCRILLDLAHEKDFKGLVAEDGETGLHFADFFNPGGIILDIELPGIDGWTVMERLKENPKTRHIPVHFISATDRPLDALRMGAAGFSTKPVSMEILDQAFRRIENISSRSVKKLLVVEDDPVQKQSIIELIGDKDVEVLSASGGEEAFEILQQEAVDCIILDLGLGDVSGYDLLTRIRKDESLPLIPVIVYTGKDISRKEETRLQKYADSIIIKGVRSPERLLDETTLFLHRARTDLPPRSQEILSEIQDRDDVLKSKRILVVDDDMRNVFALGSVLEEKGVIIYEARNGKECLERLEQRPDTDLVIMDIMMPEMDGYEAIRRIRSKSRFRKLPVIAVTAKAMKGDKLKCIEAGANDYLAKPVDTDKLISMLRVWLY